MITCTLAFSIRFIVPTASLFKTMPRTTEELCKPPPNNFATRTLSTLKFSGFLGQTWIHACNTKELYIICRGEGLKDNYSIITRVGKYTSATREQRKSSCPNCLLATAAFMRKITSSLLRTSMFSEPFSTSSFKTSMVWTNEKTIY